MVEYKKGIIMKKIHKIKLPVRSKEEGAILAALFRNIVKDLGLQDRFDDIIKKTASRHKGNKNKTEHAITNIVIGEKMTFKVFVYILKDVLNIVSFKITVELKHHNNKTTIHTLREIKLKELRNEDNSD